MDVVIADSMWVINPVHKTEITGVNPAGKHATGLFLENGVHAIPNKSSLALFT